MSGGKTGEQSDEEGRAIGKDDMKEMCNVHTSFGWEDW